MILDETYNLLRTKYKTDVNNLVISDVRIGVFLTAVLLSDGSAGVASTNIDAYSNCYIKERYFGSFSPSKIKDQKVIDLFDKSSNMKIIDTLKVAVLNALSSEFISEQNYKMIEETDPIDLIDLTPQKTISIVGAFQSYIKKIAVSKNKLYVLELNKNAFIDNQKQFYVPADKYSEILPVSDIIIITGLTLVNNTIDDLLATISPTAKVIVTGPSSSMIPDILFKNRVTIVGGTRITNSELLFKVVSEAGTGFHLFNYCAEKFCIVNE
jgi:uncharacterized protein (DUF4213/DUF364 family)